MQKDPNPAGPVKDAKQSMIERKDRGFTKVEHILGDLDGIDDLELTNQYSAGSENLQTEMTAKKAEY